MHWENAEVAKDPPGCVWLAVEKFWIDWYNKQGTLQDC